VSAGHLTADDAWNNSPESSLGGGQPVTNSSPATISSVPQRYQKWGLMETAQRTFDRTTDPQPTVGLVARGLVFYHPCSTSDDSGKQAETLR
jgi:hypothetical protein